MFAGKHHDNSKIGKIGELIAFNFLIKNGFSVIERNFRRKFGEIDIIGRSKDGILIFFEIKTIVDKPGFPDFLKPEDNLNFKKLSKLRRIAQFFARKNPSLIFEQKGWRIDLVAIILEMDEKSVKNIRHYENI